MNYNAIVIIPVLELYTPSAGISSFHQHFAHFVCTYCPCWNSVRSGKTHKHKLSHTFSQIKRLHFQAYSTYINSNM